MTPIQARRQLGAIAGCRNPRQNLPRERGHHRVAIHQIVGHEPLDPLGTPVDPLYRARQDRRQIHQIRAPNLQHRRHQKTKLVTLRLALRRIPILQIVYNPRSNRRNPVHPMSSKPNIRSMENTKLATPQSKLRGGKLLN